MGIVLNGITWDHSRGLLPVVATAQRFHELHPEVEITWEKRSLQAFGDFPVERLAGDYDLLVIDHPFAGAVARHGVLLPLEQHLPAAFLEDQAANSVGPSHASYGIDGCHYALAIDAAAPVASWRPDLLERDGLMVPRDWSELLALVRRGRVALPGVPIDTFIHFMSLAVSGGGTLGADGRFVGEEAGRLALARLRELTVLCPPEVFTWNPIRTYEALASHGGLAYCPFAFGYNNYARPGYAAHALRFGDPVALDGKEPLRTILGGTGLAVSARCAHRETALAYAMFTAGAQIQRTLYAASGGQPGHRSAWLDEQVNGAAGGFFRDTLGAHDRAFLRPRHHGFIPFQDRACLIVHDYVRNGGDAGTTLAAVERLYRESLAMD